MLQSVAGLLMALGLASCGSPAEYSWVEDRLITPGKIHAVLQCSDGPVTLEVYYPSWRVVLCDRGMDWSEGMPYEMVYEASLLDFGNRNSRVRSDLAQGGVPVPAGSFDDPRVEVALQRSLFHGYYKGEVLFALESKDLGLVGLPRLAEALIQREDTLGRGILPRMAVQQWIRGRWEPLTPFSTGMHDFRLAPEDSIRLRFRFAALRATYFRDRVELRPIGRSGMRDWRFSMRRIPGESSSVPIVPLFEMEGVPADSSFTVEFPRQHMNSRFEFSAHVEGPGIQDGWRTWYFGPCLPRTTQGMRCWGAINPPSEGPTLGPKGTRLHRETFREWPLWVTIRDLKEGRRAEPGYPGEDSLPLWARERLREWFRPRRPEKIHGGGSVR